MPRVLELCQPPDGGAAENAVQLTLGLGAHGWEAEFAGPPEARRHAILEAAHVPLHRLPLASGFGSPGATARTVRALTRLISRRGYDLVHCHSGPSGVVGRIAARRAGIPAVYSPHSFPFISELGRLRNAASLRAERTLGPSTAAILCVCEAERQIALERKLTAPERLHVVHNGCPPCDSSIAVDPALAELGRGGPLAASVAALRPQKRVDVWIDAAPLVLERIPDARVAVVGDGPLERELRERAATNGLDRDARFDFMAFEAPAARYLRALDALVLPSSWEAFPIGILEALACGVPQVATDVGGTGEAVTPETGLLVAPDDPEALAAAVCELLADAPRRRHMEAASRARHAERFGLDRMVARTAAVYEAATVGA